MSELPECICPGPNTILGNCPRHGNRAFRNLPVGPRVPSGGGEGQHEQDLGEGSLPDTAGLQADLDNIELTLRHVVGAGVRLRRDYALPALARITSALNLLPDTATQDGEEIQEASKVGRDGGDS